MKKRGPKPKKAKDKLKSRGFTCTDAEFKEIKKRAAAEGISVSEYVRRRVVSS